MIFLEIITDEKGDIMKQRKEKEIEPVLDEPKNKKDTSSNEKFYGMTEDELYAKEYEALQKIVNTTSIISMADK